jgi:hypothetical protein
MTFAGRIISARVPLENNPTGSARSTRLAHPTIVYWALAALLVPHWPKPGFECKRKTRVGIVFSEIGQSRGAFAISIVK